MNPSSSFKHQIKKRTQRLNHFVDDSVRVYSTEYFHQLRVEIKKLNAALRLVKFCSPEFSRKRILRPYRDLGKSAGEVREIQVEESVIRKLHKGKFTSDYLTTLKGQRLDKKRHFVDIKNEVKKSLQKREDKILPYADEIERDRMVDYFNRLRERCISKMKGTKLPIATIHDMRTLLKEFVYNMEVLREDAKLAFKKTIILQDLIGKWHDFHVISNHLNNYKRKAGLSTIQINQLNIVKRDISADAKQLLVRINKMKAEVKLELSEFHLI